MLNESYNLFNFGLKEKKITKKVRLIELFAGIGSQAKSLELLGVDFEHYKLAEWAVPSIIAYNSIHKKDTTDYSENKTLQEMLERIKGVSTNYNEPIAFEKLKSKPIERIKNVYNNCIATHNLINIMDVKGKDLEIVDKDKYEYILVYSFPCQDLSLAGKRALMSVSQSKGGTRSGLLWEVERILNELEKEKALPQILLMENVPQVIGKGALEDFRKWMSALERLGYTNHLEVLNAKDYGLPQNRERCFMLSLLGEDVAYEFPMPIKLKWRLKDYLEPEVDEKYYLSRKTIEQISGWNSYENPLDRVSGTESVSPCITTRVAESQDGGINESMRVYSPDLTETTNVKRLGGLYDKGNETHQAGSIYDKEGLSPTLDCSSGGGNRQPFITEQYSKESLKRIKNNIVEGDISPTITANAMQSINHQNCVLLKRGYEVEVSEEQKHSEGIDIVGNYSKSGFTQTSIVGKNGIAPTVTENHGQVTAITEKPSLNEVIEHVKGQSFTSGKNRIQEKEYCDTLLARDYKDPKLVVVDEVKLLGGIGEMKSNSGTQYYEQNRIYDSETVATSIPASPSFHPNYYTNLRIRKLTPKECMRLMGFQDKDTEAMYEAHLSNSAIYHCAGDSICVNVLIAIFAPLFDKDWRNICQLKNF